MNSERIDNEKIVILGAGSWGSTLAWLLGSSGKSLALWSHDKAKAARLQQTRKVSAPLAIDLPDSVEVVDDLSCVRDATIILLCCTAQTMREVSTRLSTELGGGGSGKILVSAAKGIELNSDLRMTEVLSQSLPDADVCVLSGPNLAAEILRGLPTATVVACQDEAIATRVQHALSLPTLRVYTNNDVAGVELGGALKNIIAIACGAVDGLDLGTNAKAALMTRGLAEMTRLAVALGAKPTTMSGLAGMGDLVATCYSSLSRNYRVGFRMARGESSNEIERELGAIAEGVSTARAVCQLSKKLNIKMPIAEQVDATVKGLCTPEKAIMSLMKRPLASE